MENNTFGEDEAKANLKDYRKPCTSRGQVTKGISLLQYNDRTEKK